MKKALNPILQVVAIMWMLFVTYKYFGHHPEYFGTDGVTSAFKQTSSIFQFLAIVGIFYVGWVFFHVYQDRDKVHFNKLTPFKVLLAFTGFLLIFADFWFLKSAQFKEASFVTANISLLSKLFIVYLTLFLLTFFSFVFGKKIFNLIKVTEKENKLADTMLSIGMGLGFMMLIVFLLGIFQQITTMNIVILFAIFTAFAYKEALIFFKRFFLETFNFEARYFSFEIFFLLTLSFVLMMNVIDLIRPMPIGWDDMGVYLNYPKQIAGNQALLAGATNNYFLIASLPFIFFKDQYLASMNGMFVSFWGGFLLLLTLSAFVKKFLKKEYSLMVMSLIYIIPMTMHQSYADMKTDMTLFFFMILSVYAFLCWFNQFVKTEKEMRKSTQKTKNADRILSEKNLAKTQKVDYKWLVLSGMFAGIAFGIKPTAILLIFAILIGIFYKIWQWKGALGIFLLELIILHSQNRIALTTNFAYKTELIFIILFILIALFVFILALRQFKKLKTVFLSFFLFGISSGLAFSPWIVKNLHENNYQISVGAILNGKDMDKPTLDLRAIGIDPAICKGTAQTEELGRYLGYEENLFERYLALPWKATMNTTVHGFYLDLSFLFLSFVPFGIILFWLRKKDYSEKKRQIWQVLILMGGASWFFWVLVGSGVIWYGIFGFLLLLLLTTYLFYENQDIALKITTGTLVVLSVFSVIALRGSKFGNGATISYAYGMGTGLQVVDNIVPNYRQIACIVTGGTWLEDSMICLSAEKTDTTPIYRIGTFIAYFIPNNNHRLFNDPQLDIFKCVDDAFGNNDLITLRKLKEAGFKYFILDLNTATIEKDPNGTLHQKANRFVEWVNNMNADMKMYVHVYNKGKGIAFMEITDEEEQN